MADNKIAEIQISIEISVSGKLYIYIVDLKGDRSQKVTQILKKKKVSNGHPNTKSSSLQ